MSKLTKLLRLAKLKECGLSFDMDPDKDKTVKDYMLTVTVPHWSETKRGITEFSHSHQTLFDKAIEFIEGQPLPPGVVLITKEQIKTSHAIVNGLNPSTMIIDDPIAYQNELDIDPDGFE